MTPRKIAFLQAALGERPARGFRKSELLKARAILGDAQQRQFEGYQTALLQRETELAALQSQINPHFLYNTLEAIRGKALLEDAPETSDMVEALARLFRYCVSMPGQLVTLEQELTSLRDYMTIQGFRFGDRFRFLERIDGDDALLSYELPKLSLQPVVENAIYHGLEGKPGPGEIALSIFSTGRRLVIRVSDDGQGMDDEALKALHRRLEGGVKNLPKGGSIGLTNVNERIKLRYGEAYGLTISSTPGVGTDVELSLPLRAEP